MKESITFSLKPNSHEIEKVRGKSCNFLKSHGLPDNTVQEHTMILNELVKTCMKYTNSKTSEKMMTVQIHISENKITVEVSNPIGEIDNNLLEELDKIIQFIRGYQDPFEALIKMKEVSKNSHFNGSGGIGLARLAYEGKTMLDFFVSDDKMMNMSAVKSIDRDQETINIHEISLRKKRAK
jgi:hypothetical protein